MLLEKLALGEIDVKAFNSLFEMLIQRASKIRYASSSLSFNSLFEMRR